MVIEKQKSYAFTTPNLEYCSSSSKIRNKRRRRRRKWRRGREVYSAKGEKRGVFYVKMKKDGGVYIVKGEGVGSAI